MSDQLPAVSTEFGASSVKTVSVETNENKLLGCFNTLSKKSIKKSLNPGKLSQKENPKTTELRNLFSVNSAYLLEKLFATNKALISYSWMKQQIPQENLYPRKRKYITPRILNPVRRWVELKGCIFRIQANKLPWLI